MLSSLELVLLFLHLLVLVDLTDARQTTFDYAAMVID